jgi:ABC-type transport system substrate-binding protein
MRRRRGLLGLIVVATTVVAACGSVGGGTAGTSKASVLTSAIGVDADTLDPMHSTTAVIENVLQMALENLTTVDESGKVQPQLATAWQESPDSMSWTFTLRPNVDFTDGTPFDAAAVKANLDRNFDPRNSCNSCGVLPKAVKSVDVIDAQHVRLTMSQPIASDVVLGLLSTGNYAFVSPRGIQPNTPGYTRQEVPVGTGPYVFKERVKGDHLTLVRNEGYWGKKPTYTEQVFRVVPDSATREALVRSGQAQMIVGPPVSDLPAMRQDPTVKVLMGGSDRMIFFAINTADNQQPLLRNPQVREALNYAVNRDAIVKSTLFGAAEPATSPVAPSVFGYCAVPNPYTYDPDLARSMLQKANASNLNVTLITPTGRYLGDWQAAQNVANDLKVIGVNVNGPSTMDWPSYVSTILVPPAKATVDLSFLGYAPGFLDASQAMANVFDPNFMPPHGQETTYYDNPAVTALLAKASIEPNRDARAQQYCDAEKQVWNDAPLIFLWVQKYPIVYSSQVTGIGAIPNESFVTTYARPAV